jgi:hypothetical protein
MRIITPACAITAVLATALTALGHDGAGGIELRHQAPARAVSMGETGLVPQASTGGFTSNPALILWSDTPGISLGYARLIEGIPASVTSVSGVMSLGSPVRVPGSDDVGRRFALGLCFDNGSVELSQGTDWGWNLLSLGAGYRLAPYASAGLALKYLSADSDLEGSGVRAYGVDLGGVVELTPRVSLGLTVRNPLGTADWDDGQSESPPLSFGAGAGFALPYGASAEVSGTVLRSNPGRLGLGANVPVAMTGFSVRAGYLRHLGDYPRNVLTGGFGYRYGKLQLDYAFKLDDELALGTTHHFCLGYALR